MRSSFTEADIEKHGNLHDILSVTSAKGNAHFLEHKQNRAINSFKASIKTKAIIIIIGGFTKSKKASCTI